MPNIDIKISQLNNLSSISGSDFFPLVQSSSLTTYRTNISELNVWFAASGSASYAPSPIPPVTYWSTSSNSSNNISNINSGFVGINQHSPAYQLDVNGNIGNSSGNLLVYGTSSYSITSSFSKLSAAVNYVSGSIFNSGNPAYNAITASYITSSNVVGMILSSSYSITSSYATNAGTVNTLDLSSIYKAGTTFVPKGGNGSVTFSTPFSSTNYAITLAWDGSLNGYNCYYTNKSTSGFTIHNGSNSSVGSNVNATWIAMAYQS